MPFPPDRKPGILEQQYPAEPLPPLNIMCSSGFIPYTTDIRWTSPDELQANSHFSIVGNNIYRSFDSEYGPYVRLNVLPVGAGFYRDRLLTQVAMQEDVSDKFEANPLTDPAGRCIFKVRHPSIVLDLTPAPCPNCTELNMYVTVNGQQAAIESINAQTGEVEISQRDRFDVASQTVIKPVVPTNLPGLNNDPTRPTDVVLATYRYQDPNEKPTGLDQRTYYRVTTVARHHETGVLTETPLDRAAEVNNRQIEQLDWIWREAIRRQRYLLDQGGERVKLFIMKSVGPICGCYSIANAQPDNSCRVCYGTGIIGGYDGPYDIVLAPEDEARSIQQSNRGRTVLHSYETWTLPSPLLSQRDFLVKLNGDRYGIGPVRMPSNRGIQLQQMFPVSHLDYEEIRYKVPVLDTLKLVSPQTRYVIPGQGKATPEMTDREDVPAEHQIRGNTVTFENQQRR